jgi:O-antigen biosynthesis protein
MPHLFSVITPVYEAPEDVLRECIDSVLNQDYPHFELCLVDDASPSPHIRRVLDEAAKRDPRVRVQYRSENGGIVAASNDALKMATGDFVALLDNDDLLVPHALGAVNHLLELDGIDDIDYLYSDEDKLTPEGYFTQTFLKPDWSPERFRSQMYCCHLSVMRRSLVEEVGGFRPGYDGSQDYDLVLRVTERARRVAHLADVLYHWRILPTSTAASSDAKPYARDAGLRAVQAHCDRVGIDAVVEPLKIPGTHRVRRAVKGEPLVSIIIPTGGTAKRVWGANRVLVLEVVRSILEKSTYQNFEVVVVADATMPLTVVSQIEELLGSRLKMVWFQQPFHFSRKCNLGASQASGEYLLLLNDDMEIVTPDWIETLLGLAQEPDVGMVGAKLLLSDGTLQHAGHVYKNSCPFHMFIGHPADDPGPSCMLLVERECSGVTAACAMIRADVWNEVGGLSEQLPNNFNDVDLSLKIRHLHYRIVWTPHAVLYHFESLSRDNTVTQKELDFIQTRWSQQLRLDPYHNVGFDSSRHDWVPL